MSDKTLLELEREGASAARATNKLIEPLPRKIAFDVRWLLNQTTGYIEVNHPLLAALGDTIYVEYEPSKDELARLKAGQRVLGGHSGDARRIDLSAAPSMLRAATATAEAAFNRKPDLFEGLDKPEPKRAVPKAVQAAKAQQSAADHAAALLASLPMDDEDDVPADAQPAALSEEPAVPAPSALPADVQRRFAGYKPKSKV